MGVPGSSDVLVDELFTTTQRLQAYVNSRLRVHGASVARLRALRMLASSPEPLRMRDLSDMLGVAARTATDLVDALERDGLVERRTLADDRRVQVFHLTPAGATLLGHAAEGRLRAFRQRLADWAEPELTTFAAHLERYNADGR